MTQRAGPIELQVPLERLERRPPVRGWTAEVTAARVAEADGAMRVADVEVAPDQPIQVEVVLDSVSEGVMVTGTVSVAWNAACARCLRDVAGTSVAEVRELFELAPTEGESYLLGTEIADLTELVRDAVLLELPIGAVHCPDDDPCPEPDLGPDITTAAVDAEGGADAEIGEPARDPRWAALDALTFDEEEAAEADEADDEEASDR